MHKLTLRWPCTQCQNSSADSIGHMASKCVGETALDTIGFQQLRWGKALYTNTWLFGIKMKIQAEKK